MLHRELRGVDRRTEAHGHLAGMQCPIAFAHQVLRARNGYGNHRHARLDRHHERALLEWAQAAIAAPRALGYTANESPSFRRAIAISTLPSEVSGSRRSTGTNCAMRIAVAKMGMRNSSFFTRSETRRGIAGTKARGSTDEMWFAANTHTPAGIFSMPSTRTRIPAMRLPRRTAFIATAYVKPGLPVRALQRISHGNTRSTAKKKKSPRATVRIIGDACAAFQSVVPWRSPSRMRRCLSLGCGNSEME